MQNTMIFGCDKTTSNVRIERSLPLLFAFMAMLCAKSLEADSISQEQRDFFENKIRPTLVEHCYSCHGENEADRGGSLRLDHAAGLLQGGTLGPSIVASKPEESVLVRAIEYRDASLQMPPDGKLPEEAINQIKDWIRQGAADPRDQLPTNTNQPSVQPTDKSQLAKTHWAYKPLASSEELFGHSDNEKPTAEQTAKELDKRIGAKIRSMQIKAHSESNRTTLVRRLYHDLTGLMPSFDELAEIASIQSDDWYEQVVERLLSSPHFGERMARRWMDVTRYADNKGYVFVENREYPHAYRYRDWLIKAFNRDLSFNDFVHLQICGEQIDPENKKGDLDAMGMLTLGRRFLQNKNDIADDRIDVVSRGFLGITASCARCHDHKFDPVSAGDYYSLFNAFIESEEPADEPSPMRLVDRKDRGATVIFLRGNPANHGATVERKVFVGILGDKSRPMDHGSGRIDLADAIVSDFQPLSARVYVNRIWGWLNGKHLVSTPSDFGLRCEEPKQQDVLDLLARSFVDNQGSTKHLVRSIVLSKTYRLSSRFDAASFAIDPENQYLWRAQRRRMDFETYRDNLLLGVGKLDRTVGGKSETIHVPPFSKRRTLYAYIDRQNLPSLFRTFDFASPDAHVPQRSQTTVPQQGLVLMNSDLMMDLLEGVDSKYRKATSKSQEVTKQYHKQIIASLFRRILSRTPTDQEMKLSLEFLDSAVQTMPDIPENTWRYGIGTMNKDHKELTAFQPLKTYNGKGWTNTSGQLPDPVTGWSHITADGGHPGGTDSTTSVRRWVAPSDGYVHINSHFKHPSDQGDGVRATIFVRNKEQIGSWDVKNSERSIDIDRIDVKAGDTIDFVVDCFGNESNDAYAWHIKVRYEGGSTFDSRAHFSTQQPLPLTALEQLAQMLLLSNEFCFVD